MPQDYAEFLHWARLAAAQTPHDADDMSKRYRTATADAIGAARFDLGHGFGVALDYAEATRFYRSSADPLF